MLEVTRCQLISLYSAAGSCKQTVAFEYKLSFPRSHNILYNYIISKKHEEAFSFL